MENNIKERVHQIKALGFIISGNLEDFKEKLTAIKISLKQIRMLDSKRWDRLIKSITSRITIAHGRLITSDRSQKSDFVNNGNKKLPTFFETLCLMAGNKFFCNHLPFGFNK